MLRPGALCVCVTLGLMVVPTPAYAWWDFIEGFSGPQNFYGWDIQVRLFCIVDKVQEKQETVNGKRVRFNEIEEGATEKLIPSAIGVVASACKVKASDPDQKGDVKTYWVRRVALDVGARFLHAKDPDFATGHRIDFSTLEPSVSINLFSKWPSYDYVDYGFGAGAYWFSSTEFSSFVGAFIEPIRFEFHPSTKLKVKLDRWASVIPNLRVGLLYFPAGFETAAWNAGPGIQPRIGRERVLNLAVFFDLEPLLR
jgi:hypothetical protein